jgi:hypothetical protein
MSAKGVISGHDRSCASGEELLGGIPMLRRLRLMFLPLGLAPYSRSRSVAT